MLIFAKEGLVSIYTLVTCLFVTLVILVSLNQIIIQKAIKEEYISNYKDNIKIKNLSKSETGECHFYIAYNDFYSLDLNQIVSFSEYNSLSKLYSADNENQALCVEELNENDTTIIFITNEYSRYTYILNK